MMQSRFIFYLTVFLVFTGDQLTKLLIVMKMKPHQSIPILKDIFRVTYVQNTGAAFGVLHGYNWLLFGIGVVVLLVVLYFHFKLPAATRLPQIVLGLIFGGSIGNLLDRVMRGFVIDFIDFRFWPVFNFADMCINIGIFMLIFYLFFKKGEIYVSSST